MKPRRLIAVMHSTGVIDYACRKCGELMKHEDNYTVRLCGGDLVESGDEYLVCPSCGQREKYPHEPVGELPEARF